jgi:hypothetical protein
MHKQANAEEPYLKLPHLSPIAVKKVMVSEHFRSESSQRLSFAMTEAAESSRRLQLTVRLRTAPFPARILLRIAFDGANACDSERTNPQRLWETVLDGYGRAEGGEWKGSLTDRSMVVMAEMAAEAAPRSARQDVAAEQASPTSSRPSTSTRSASGSLSTRSPPSELPEASPRLPPPSPAAARGFFSMAFCFRAWSVDSGSLFVWLVADGWC